MAHPARTQPDANWFPMGGMGNYAPLPGDFFDLDRKLFQSINGRDGGTWVIPTTIIGGQGMQVSGPTVLYGPAIISTDAGSDTILLGDNDFQDLAPGHVGRTRDLLTGLGKGFGTAVMPAVPGLSPTTISAVCDQQFWAFNSQYMAMQSIALTFTTAGGTDTVGSYQDTRAPFTPELWCPIRVHNAATFTQAVFTFRVPTPRTKTPGSMPKFRVIRKATDGTIVPLKSQTKDASGFTADVNGFISPATVASGAAWYAGGQAQTITYLCDQNNVIDRSQFTYFVHIVEEGGATDYPLALRMLDPVRCASAGANVPLGPGLGSPVDGVSLANGDRVLCKDQTAPTANGIYVASSTTAWNSSPDANASEKILRGMLVPVISGAKNGATVWQLQTTPPLGGYQVGGPSPTALGFLSQPVPNGNIYHSVLCTMTNITSTAWQ